MLAIDAPEATQRALEELRRGHPVVFPTDTVYGVGVPATNAEAVVRLYAIKCRPRNVAIPVLLADAADLERVASAVPPLARELAQRYWPGGLTLVVPAAAHLPAALLAGGASVAARLPAHAWLQNLIRLLGEPLAATSANLHASPTPHTAAGVAAQLGAGVRLVVDGGESPAAQPSTVVDCTGPQPVVLRQGSVSIHDHYAASRR
jgi:L-threonylcarbamoyladenylate synthase